MHSSNIFKSLICNRSVTSLTSSFWMARILWRAASQFALFPVITIVSELLFSAGRSILVLLSSRICHKKKKKNHFRGVPHQKKALGGYIPHHQQTGKNSKRDLAAGSYHTEHQRQESYITFLMLAPPFPMMFLWNCLKMGTEIEKLFST